MSDDVEGVYDGPCVVCGETVKGRPYLTLALFSVMDGDGQGLYFKPNEAPDEVSDWDEIPHARAVHMDCSATYFEAVLADLEHQRRQESSE